MAKDYLSRPSPGFSIPSGRIGSNRMDKESRENRDRRRRIASIAPRRSFLVFFFVFFFAFDGLTQLGRVEWRCLFAQTGLILGQAHQPTEAEHAQIRANYILSYIPLENNLYHLNSEQPASTSTSSLPATLIRGANVLCRPPLNTDKGKFANFSSSSSSVQYN